MSKARLTNYDKAVFRGMWVLTGKEKEKLEHFFLLKDTWANLEKDFTIDKQELKRFLKHDGRDYEVILMSPVKDLEHAEKLGLSFRVHRGSGLRVVLIREWFDAETETVSNG